MDADKIRELGERDLERGEGFLRHSMWDEAILALGDAETMLPDDLRVLHARARAHFRRGRRGDDAQVRELARRCLELQPDHEASFALIKQLDARPRRRSWRWPLVAGLAVAAGGVGYAVVRTPRSHVPALCGEGVQYCHVPVPVAWTGAGEMTLAPGVLDVGPEAIRLALSGRITHRGTTELDEMRLAIKLLDERGQPVGQIVRDAQPGFAPPLRSGDAATFYLLEKVPPETRRIEVGVAGTRTTRAPELYGAGTAVDLQFDPPAPAEVALRAAYRKRQAHVYSDKTAVEGVLEVENGGTGVVRELELELRALGPDGRVVGEPAKETVAYSHMLPMEPGERRLVRFHLYVPGTVAGERVVVTKVD
jgi:hypothetical protein